VVAAQGHHNVVRAEGAVCTAHTALCAVQARADKRFANERIKAPAEEIVCRTSQAGDFKTWPLSRTAVEIRCPKRFLESTLLAFLPNVMWCRTRAR